MIENFVGKNKMDWVKDYCEFHYSLITGKDIDHRWFNRQLKEIGSFPTEKKEALFELDDFYNHLFPCRVSKSKKWVLKIIDFYRRHDTLPKEDELGMASRWFYEQLNRERKKLIMPTEQRALFLLYSHISKLDYTLDLSKYVEKYNHYPSNESQKGFRIYFWIKSVHKCMDSPPEPKFNSNGSPLFVDKLVEMMPELPISL